jgi:hypothetical protein
MKLFHAKIYLKNFSEDIKVCIVLLALCSSPNVIWVIKLRIMRWAGYVAHVGKRRGAYRVLVGKPEGTRPHGRH